MIHCKNKYFIGSEIMLIISLRRWEIFYSQWYNIHYSIVSKKFPWYIELFELCKTSISRHLHTIPMFLSHDARSDIIIYYSHRPLGISKIISRGGIAPSEMILIFLIADGNDNIIFLFWRFQRPQDLWVLKWGSDCFKGCYNVKNEYFIDSEIMLIISLSRWEIFLLAVI